MNDNRELITTSLTNFMFEPFGRKTSKIPNRTSYFRHARSDTGHVREEAPEGVRSQFCPGVGDILCPVTLVCYDPDLAAGDGGS